MQEVLGHREILEELGRELYRLSHAYLFVGQKGVGKYNVAYWFAKEILKMDPAESADYHEVSPQGKSIGIDQIRAMISSTYKSSYHGSYRVYLIKDGELMTREAQNSLLKTLEEPPSNTIILIIQNSTNKLLPTVVSRCKTIRIPNIRDEVIIDYAKAKGYRGDFDALLSYSEGSIDRAEEYILDGDLSKLRDNCLLMASYIAQRDKGRHFDISSFIDKNQDRLRIVVGMIVSFLRDGCIYSLSSQELLINKDKISTIKEMSKHLKISDLAKFDKWVSDFNRALEHNCNLLLNIDCMLIGMMED